MRIKLLTLIFLILPLSAFTQQKSDWFMTRLPGRLNVNPAQETAFKGYWVFPLIDFSVTAASSLIQYKDLESNGEIELTAANLDALASKAKSNNTINLQTDINLLAFGFTAGKSFITFSSTTHMQSKTNFNDGFFALRYGMDDYINQPQGTYHVELGNNTMAYMDLSLGIARQVNDKLRIGGRLKYLNGISNIDASKLNMQVETDLGTISVSPDAVLRTALPTQTTLSSEGYVEDISLRDDLGFGDFTGNNGWGLDLGATYELTDKLTLGVSVTDFGKINWKENITEYNMNTSFTFSQALTGDSDDNSYWEDLTDNLKESMTMTTNAEGFKTNLNTRIHITGEYQLTKHLTTSGYLGYQRLFEKWHPTLALGGSFRTRCLEAALFYNATMQTYDNLGAGLNLNLGPLTIYMATDNLMAALDYKSANLMSARFGVNFLFGRSIKKEKNNTQSLE